MTNRPQQPTSSPCLCCPSALLLDLTRHEGQVWCRSHLLHHAGAEECTCDVHVTALAHGVSPGRVCGGPPGPQPGQRAPARAAARTGGAGQPCAAGAPRPPAAAAAGPAAGRLLSQPQQGLRAQPACSGIRSTHKHQRAHCLGFRAAPLAVTAASRLRSLDQIRLIPILDRMLGRISRLTHDSCFHSRIYSSPTHLAGGSGCPHTPCCRR